MAVLKPFSREVSAVQDDLMDELIDSFWKPWVVAQLLFAPWFESATPVIERIGTARAWVGFLITVWMCWPYVGFGFVQGFLDDVGRTIFIAGIAAVAVLVGGFFLHANDDRKHYLRGAAFPFGRVAVGIVIVELVGLLFQLHLNFIVAVISVVLGIWLLAFFGCAFWQIGKALFGTSDAHPMLGPVTTALTLTVALVYKLGFGRTALPIGVSLTIDFVGYLTAVGLCWYELMRVLAIQRLMTEQHVDVEEARRALGDELREWWRTRDLRALGPSLWAVFRGHAPATGPLRALSMPESTGEDSVSVDEDNAD
ncbi:MAG TPA: hypothetical protein VHV74_18335 [Pseudonocardiaceae bacterium]|nr:hypothetical protein [Pseudonocardiaceae bacterium]